MTQTSGSNRRVDVDVGILHLAISGSSQSWANLIINPPFTVPFLWCEIYDVNPDELRTKTKRNGEQAWTEKKAWTENEGVFLNNSKFSKEPLRWGLVRKGSTLVRVKLNKAWP